MEKQMQSITKASFGLSINSGNNIELSYTVEFIYCSDGWVSCERTRRNFTMKFLENPRWYHFLGVKRRYVSQPTYTEYTEVGYMTDEQIADALNIWQTKTVALDLKSGSTVEYLDSVFS